MWTLRQRLQFRTAMSALLFAAIISLAVANVVYYSQYGVFPSALIVANVAVACIASLIVGYLVIDDAMLVAKTAKTSTSTSS